MTNFESILSSEEASRILEGQLQKDLFVVADKAGLVGATRIRVSAEEIFQKPGYLDLSISLQRGAKMATIEFPQGMLPSDRVKVYQYLLLPA